MNICAPWESTNAQLLQLRGAELALRMTLSLQRATERRFTLKRHQILTGQGRKLSVLAALASQRRCMITGVRLCFVLFWSDS